jgi:hypothetical protein
LSRRSSLELLWLWGSKGLVFPCVKHPGWRKPTLIIAPEMGNALVPCRVQWSKGTGLGQNCLRDTIPVSPMLNFQTSWLCSLCVMGIEQNIQQFIALRSLWKEDRDLKSSLCYIMRFCLKITKPAQETK